MGGVAHKPWRVPAAEAALEGGPATPERFTAAADIVLAGAKGFGGSDFKISLARRAIVTACRQAAEGKPQSQTNKRIN